MTTKSWNLRCRFAASASDYMRGAESTARLFEASGEAIVIISDEEFAVAMDVFQAALSQMTCTGDRIKFKMEVAQDSRTTLTIRF
jgi:hypothetical protein